VQEIRIQGEVPASPQAVWDVYTDHRSWEDWAGFREVVLRQQGEPAPNGVGATRVMRARGMAIEEEVIAFDPPKRMVYRLVAGAPVRNHQGEVLFTPSEIGTHVEWIVRFDPWIPFTGALVARLLRPALQDVLDRLAAYPFERPA